MSIDTIIGKDPENFSLEETEDALSRIIAYEQRTGLPSGVLLIQSRQFGARRRISTEQEAKEWMSKPVVDDGKGNRTPEFGVSFQSKAYFKERIEKLKQEQQYKE